MTLPLSAAFGLPPQLDQSIGLSISSNRTNQQDIQLPDEAIFAVAYDVVSLKTRLDPATPGFLRTEKEMGKQKRTKAQQLALEEGDSDGEVEIEEDESDRDLPSRRVEAEDVEYTGALWSITMAGFAIEF